MTINSSRNYLLENNQDKFAGLYNKVFNISSFTSKKIVLNLKKDTLVTNADSNKLKGLDVSKDILVLNMKDFLKGEINYLNLNSENFLNQIDENDKNNYLCSVGVIDLIDSEYIDKNGDKQIRTHMYTILRDSGGASSANLRTSSAGRMVGDNIKEEMDREYIEESPFLGKINGVYYLAIPKTGEYEKNKIIKWSINHFMSEKYLRENDENYLGVKKMFERSFPGISYLELGQILLDISNNNRFVEFEYDTLFDINGLEDSLKEVTIGNNTGKFYTFYNPDLKTFEFKHIRKIKSFPIGFTHISKRPGRLFLESMNQYPRFPRISNAHRNSANAIKGITEVFKEKAIKLI